MRRRILPVLVIFGVLVAGLLSSASPVLAQISTAVVSPDTVFNTTANTLLITITPIPTPVADPTPTPQTFFVAPVSVEVVDSGLGVLDATVLSTTRISFTLPAGCPPNTYNLVINNGGDPDPINVTNQLVVRSPAPTPDPATPPGPTNTPLPTNYVRPMVTVQSYGASSEKLTPGQDFEMELTLQNTGRIMASNIVANFIAGEFVPRATGGVKAVGDLEPGQSSKFNLFFTATTELTGKKVGIMEVRVSYTDIYGAPYEETFTLTFPMVASGGSGPAPTSTVAPRPQLIISGYHSDVEMLQPGTEFTLELNVRNVGNSMAKSVSAIVGGGSTESGSSGGDGEAPGPGGISGGGGEFSDFAPVGSSNIQVLGDMEAGVSKRVAQKLIVNVSTEPGAYPLKVSFAYSDEQDSRFTDDQVITLLVYKMPTIDVSFYRPLDPFFVGQMGMLPIQVANLGRSSAVLGTMTVTAGNAEMFDNTLIVGNVDPGFPITMDAMLTPVEAGTLEVSVVIEYTDDFSKARTITETLEVEVMESPGEEMGMGGEMGEFMPPPLQPETFMQKVWRFIRGFIGLDSARTDTQGMFPEGMPPEMVPSEEMMPAERPPEEIIKPIEPEG
ncbi:MAG: hypothetical protein JXB30_07795 [Anaerolineae bacterium]|nr:hypothetical protein [Anaerolineae bacterium]